MGHAIPRGRAIGAPRFFTSLRRRHRGEVVAIRAEVDETGLGLELSPGDERYYELGCLPPGHHRDVG
jgi:hypothetical protein